jgi:hypothetical protein
MVMRRKQLAPGITVYSDVIDGYETLIQDIEDGIVSAGLEWVQSSVKKNDTTQVDTESRDTLTIGVPYNDHIVEDFLNLNNAFASSLSNIFLLGFRQPEIDYKMEHNVETTWHDQYGILKYGQGQKFINHIDDHKDYHRRISTVYYMNDNYSGGEIVFPRFGIRYKPKANELLIFPSTYVYNHSVLPVTEGIRYAVVSWLR